MNKLIDAKRELYHQLLIQKDIDKLSPIEVKLSYLLAQDSDIQNILETYKEVRK
jgi:hypothetical protein